MAGSFSFDGIVSGLDTASIIARLTEIERRPVQLLQVKVDREASRTKALNSIKSQISSLQGTVGRLVARGAVNAKAAATDTPFGSPTILTATAGADAANGTFKVTVSQLATSTKVVSGSAMGQVIDQMATLASAGFRLVPVVTNSTGGAATLTINGQTISVDGSTTLNDGTANSLINKINGSGAGVTATLVADSDGRANNRVQVVSAAGQSLQLGALSDTSNMLRLLNLADATVQGYTAATVSSAAAGAGALNTSVTIDGVTTSINQGNGGFTSTQNAQFIADALNANTSSTVTATANGDGTFTLAKKTLGSQQSIAITAPGTDTGLSVGTTQNGTDRALGTLSLGATDVGKQLAASRLVTPIAGLDGSGNGSLTINGVQISYKSTDSLSSIISRINASTAGVSAFYDSVQDRLRITANQTGGRTITMADTQGNFLAATGVLGASQTLGQNAVVAIDSVNGGQSFTSASNTITGMVAGVTLDLKATSASPITVTVSQNAQAAVDVIKEFVNRINQTLDAVQANTSYDAENKKSQPLTGDSGIAFIEQSLRSLVNAPGLGLTGAYKNLATIGVSTGAVGTAVGKATRLVLDETKLRTALTENPQAVEALIGSFAATLGAPSGAGNVTAVSGTPLNQHVSGTYYVKILDGAGKAEARLVTADGRTVFTSTGTLTAGQDNTVLIPGVRLTVAGALTVGEDSFAMTVNTRGVAVQLEDTVNGWLGATGYFANRESSSQSVSSTLTKQMAVMEERVKQREEALRRKFSTLEAALARLQTQSASLNANIARMAASSPR